MTQIDLPDYTLPRPAAHRAIPALMLREIATTYGRTPGGWVWSVAEPVGAIALLSFAFSLAFAAPPLGQSFMLFYATGYLPFMMFLDLSSKIANALRFSRPLLHYPALARVDALLARLILNTLTHAVVGCVVLGGITLFDTTGAAWDPAGLVLVYGLTAWLAFAIGTLNCVLFARFRVWERLWQIAMRPMFVISGIFFVIEALPATYRDLAWWNPLLHITGLMRAAALPIYGAPLASPAFVAAVGIGALTLGLLALRILAKDPAHV